MSKVMGVFLTRMVKHPLLRIICWIYLIYLAIAITFISPLLNGQISHWYQQHTGRPLHFEVIHFNPFTLSLTLRNASDKNPAGNLLWSVQRLYINLSLTSSLLELTPVIDDISIEQPRIHPERLAGGQWNFADIIQHQAMTENSAAEMTPPENAALPALAIRRIHINEGTIAFTDSSLKKPISVILNSISFDMENFSTLSDKEQSYLLRATLINADTAKTRGELVWQGNLSLHQGYDSGVLALKNTALAPLWPYIKSSFNFTLHNANASWTGQYHVNWKNTQAKQTIEWTIEEGQLQLDNIGLTSGKKNARNAEITTNQLLLDKINISSQQESVAIADIRVDGLHVKSWSEGEEAGIIRALKLKGTTESTETDTPWTIVIGNLAVKKSAIDWRVAELEQHTFKVRKLTLAAAPIEFNSATPAVVNLKAIIDKSIGLSLNGQINVQQLDGNLTTEITQFPLALIKPLLAPYVNSNKLSGFLDARTDIEIQQASPTHIKSQGQLVDITLNPAPDTQELLTWKSLAWRDAHIDIPQQHIKIPLVTLDGLDGRLTIATTGKTNLQGLFPETTQTPPNDTSTPWQFTVDTVAVNKASFRFHDESLTPNFTAAVQNFSGAIKNISSTSAQAASFSFHGDVDNYAPVRLQGKTQPFLAQPQLDAQLDFENMDLGGFSGYSSTYAGWRIERGLLTANLHYRLADGLIVGDNHIEMDQLQLGERVKSATAMDVPLRLALALITDENGLATLDFDVSGKPDAPDFDISKILWSALRNTVKKIVKSPLKLLARLVGSKEDLGELPFNSGSSKLLTTATRKLNTLQQAMDKRPALRIELRGSYDPVTDKRGLQAAQITQTLLDSGLTNKDIKAKNQRWQAAIANQYRKLDLGDSKELPAEKMYEQWLQTIAVPEEQLSALAAARSINAKQFLVQHLKIDNNRVLINASLECDKPKFCGRRLVRIDLSDISQLDLSKIP